MSQDTLCAHFHQIHNIPLDKPFLHFLNLNMRQAERQTRAKTFLHDKAFCQELSAPIFY